MLITKKYFEAWNNRDLSSLSEMFSDNIILKDWENVYNGKEKVLKANADIFNSFKNIELTVVNEASKFDTNNDSYIHYCELSIMLDKDIINVIDVIRVKDNLITSIKAYKG